ncbi:MAG TPA: hypothetical protein PKW33_11010 [Anaerolineaceae bacterium]|nr:hypothetical protein [Anaerolineaceae bacterium]HPN52108.1 hypothetical protein [Anaerolineaceae bacterium]
MDATISDMGLAGSIQAQAVVCSAVKFFATAQTFIFPGCVWRLGKPGLRWRNQT